MKSAAFRSQLFRLKMLVDVFSVVVLFVFWCVFVPFWVSFWNVFRTKISSTYIFAIFISFLLFVCFGGFYFRLMLVLLSVQCSHRVLITFGFRFGVILVPFFGNPNRSFFGSCFCSFFVSVCVCVRPVSVCVRVCPRAAKSGPRAAKSR